MSKNIAMPYILISTQIRLTLGPTNCGDEWADPEVMNYLGAELVHHFGNSFREYISSDPPRVVLNKLEQLGYKVAASTGVGQTIVWTMYKPDEECTTEKAKADRHVSMVHPSSSVTKR